MAMAASKENQQQNYSSSHPYRSYTSLRAPLSPLHQNFAPPPTPTAASRRCLRDPQKPYLLKDLQKSYLPRSPGQHHHHPHPPPVPRTPIPTRRNLRDASAMESVSRSRALPPRDRLSSVAAPRGNMPIVAPPRPKRQTQLFPVLQPHDTFYIDKTTEETCDVAGSGTANAENEGELQPKPCRRKWRRLERESVLRSLRGEGTADDRKADAKPNPISTDMSLNTIKENPNPNSSHGSVSVGAISSTVYQNPGRCNKKGSSISTITGDGDGRLRKTKSNLNSVSVYVDKKSRDCTQRKGPRKNVVANSSRNRKEISSVAPAPVKSSIEKKVQFQSPLDPISEETTFGSKADDNISATALEIITENEEVSRIVQIFPPCDLQISLGSEEVMTLADTAKGTLAVKGDILKAATTTTVIEAQCSSRLTLTPPSDKTSLLADRKLTPPMQTTLSPDFIKKDGMRAVLPIDAVCYAAPSGMVKDKRRCKPRGVLTVDGFHETLSSEDSGFQVSVQKMPSPAVASVVWMREKKVHDDGNGVISPDFASNSLDLCRMSFPRFSPSPFPAQIQPELDIELESEDPLRIEILPTGGPNDAKIDDDSIDRIPSLIRIGALCEPDVANTASLTALLPIVNCGSNVKASIQKQDQVLQASVSVSGYEWEASSSQGMLSSCHTELGSCNPRRSIMFGEEEGMHVMAAIGTQKMKSNFVNNILFEDSVDTLSQPLITFSDEYENGDYLEIEKGAETSSERSPPFEYAVMRSLMSKEFTEESKCVPEEVIVSISGPSDLSMSLQDGGLVSLKVDSFLSSQDPAFLSFAKTDPSVLLKDHKHSDSKMDSSSLSQELYADLEYIAQSVESTNESKNGYEASKMDLSLSSQELQTDLDYIVQSVESAKNMPLVCIQQANSALHGMDYKEFDIAAGLHIDPNADISSRIAMARFLCNITATYLDDIASCLGNDGTNNMSSNMLKNDISEFTGSMKRFEQTSMLAGKEKMAECCSLLRGLTLEAPEKTRWCSNTDHKNAMATKD